MQVSLEAYQTERADFERSLAAIRTIRGASMEQLLNLDWLVELVRSVGLVPIPEFATTYEADADFVNGSQQGLIQLPREFARYLLLLAQERPATYLEIGCCNGASVILACAYLQRFNPQFQATTVDIWPGFIFYSEVRDLLPLQYEVSRTSYDFKNRQFDAVFIDGDHSFDWSWADYQNVGRTARTCAFHDIVTAPYLDFPLGGVCAVWELLKSTEPNAHFSEIIEHSNGDVMGIGVRIRK